MLTRVGSDYHIPSYSQIAFGKMPGRGSRHKKLKYFHPADCLRGIFIVNS